MWVCRYEQGSKLVTTVLEAAMFQGKHSPMRRLCLEVSYNQIKEKKNKNKTSHNTQLHNPIKHSLGLRRKETPKK